MLRPRFLLPILLVACGTPAPSHPAVAPVPVPVPLPVPDPPRAADPPCLSLVTWNDMHGQLTPDVVQVDTGPVPAGGVVAVADAVAAVRASGDAVVVLDAGDLFVGPLESALPEGAPVIAAYDAIGVDAAAVGNHEFDFGPVGYDRVTAPAGKGDADGPDGPRGALLARMSEAKFPFVAANIFTQGGNRPPWPDLHPSVRIARGGFDVGVVGYSTRDTPTTTIKPNVDDLDFTQGAADAVATEIRALRAAHAFPVVLLAHASLDGDLPQRLDDPKDPEGQKRVGEMARLMDDLGADKPDIVVAGHRHAWLLGKVRGVPIISTDQHGVGVARIRYCKGKLESIEREVTIASSPPRSSLGKEVEAKVAPWLEKVAAEASQPVATVPRACAAQALDGTALAEQLARSLAEHASAAGPPPPGARVVGLTNTGGIRTSLRQGVVRFTDVFAVSPFENAVAACATTRAGLAHILTNAIKRPIAHERMTFGIAGAHVTMKRDAQGALTLAKLELDGDKPGKTKDDDPVWLAVPDFILWGGDGLLEGVTCTASAHSQLRTRDAWREVLAREASCDGPPKNVSVER